MWVSASTNIRVASAARRSYDECLHICFRGGAFSAVLCITLCVFGVTLLYCVLSVLFVNTDMLKPEGRAGVVVHILVAHKKMTLAELYVCINRSFNNTYTHTHTSHHITSYNILYIPQKYQS
jgi:Na+/H+-translocating membrane pyrophosphatase